MKTKTKIKSTILCIDDNPYILGLISDIFEHDYDVKITDNYEYALNMCRKCEIGVIIADQNMPDISGIEFLVKVNKLNPISKKLIFTGFGKTDTIRNAINLGVVDEFVSKPCDIDDIKIRVHTLLEDYLSDKHKIYLEWFDNDVIDDKLPDKFLQNSKMATLGEMATGVIHEIRNPLTYVCANLQILKNVIKDDTCLNEGCDQVDAVSTTLENIDKKKLDINYTYLKARTSQMIEKAILGADRIKKIVNEFGMLSRNDYNRITKVNITDLIESSLEIIMYNYKDKIEIKKDYDKNLAMVECLPSKLNQVFLNILVNACQSIEGNGTIIIKTMADGGNAMISISDTGHGIPADFKDKIFDSFFTTKSSKNGMGLGLSISNQIIKQHNGELSVFTKENKGTTFTITIPICAEINI